MKKGVMDEACSTHRVDEKCVQNFGRKSEGKRPLGRPRNRWEDNIRMDNRGIGWEVLHWMPLAQDKNQWWALMNIVINFWVP
jgi:hypothetical protein